MANMDWFYDEESGRYVVKGARILFPNFEGAEQDYNQAGKRNFRLVLDAPLAEEMRKRGIYVRERPGRDELDETQYLMKIGVYQDADVRLKSGRTPTPLSFDNLGMVDREFRKGHVCNGEIGIEFHVTRNTKVQNGSLYARLDTAIIPIRKSRLLEEYDDVDDDEIPFE